MAVLYSGVMFQERPLKSSVSSIFHHVYSVLTSPLRYDIEFRIVQKAGDGFSRSVTIPEHKKYGIQEGQKVEMAWLGRYQLLKIIESWDVEDRDGRIGSQVAKE